MINRAGGFGSHSEYTPGQTAKAHVPQQEV